MDNSPRSSKQVSAQETKTLYRDLRKAVLTSKARELQKQQYEYLRQRVDILDVKIDNVAFGDFLDNLQQGVVFTPNVDHLVRLQKDPAFVAAYRKADYRVCDSQVLLLASKFLGDPIKAKISGSDLFPRFCEYHKDNPDIKIFLMGGAEGVAAEAQRRLNAKAGRDIVVQSHSPSFGFEKDDAECEALVDMIRQSPANVLVVGLGAPKQELWIAKYRDRLPNIKIFLAVGAAIDFEAGNKARAPQWMSSAGLEWTFRLIQEPRRLWRRYIHDDMPFFLRLIVREKLARLRNKPRSGDPFALRPRS